MTVPRQGAIGLSLAVAIMFGWIALEAYAIFAHPLGFAGALAAPLLIAAICWLNVGLFIIAHDAMHGSLAPGRPGFNRAVGRLALGLYAGFSYDALLPKHLDHHRRPGTPDDPDFDADNPRHLWRWYSGFIRRYFGWRQLMILSVVFVALLLLGARYANVMLFWALPAILSSFQLFYFGTYLPHRHEDAEFADDHRARSNQFTWLGSLLSCFHFGYHHEHHLAPSVPWWRLPSERKHRASARSGPRPA
ncbi:fatty acid desaturase [Sphingomonas sinipercae]|uniref:fatty acid desaturase n=1 Tax=Sphingomonas sinipercae TaxID=2714944 RepID=UPI001FE694EB|nr:fatty acid desaturase [Sphingomonas sinipercae]